MEVRRRRSKKRGKSLGARAIGQCKGTGTTNLAGQSKVVAHQSRRDMLWHKGSRRAQGHQEGTWVPRGHKGAGTKGQNPTLTKVLVQGCSVGAYAPNLLAKI